MTTTIPIDSELGRSIIQRYINELQGLSRVKSGQNFISTAQCMNTQPKVLRKFIQDAGWIYRDPETSKWFPNQSHVDVGLLAAENGTFRLTTLGQIMLSVLTGKVINCGDVEIDPRYFTDGRDIWKFTPGQPTMIRSKGNEEWQDSSFASVQELKASSPDVTNMHPNDGECDWD